MRRMKRYRNRVSANRTCSMNIEAFNAIFTETLFPPPVVETRTTGINLPSDVHALLRAVALKRAKEMGGRPSVSAILVGLVRQHQTELEDEAGRYLELLDLL